MLKVLLKFIAVLIQTGPGSHPMSCTIGNGSLSRGTKWPGCGTDYPPPSSAKVKEKVELNSAPPLGLCDLFQSERLFYTVNKLIEICLF